MLRFLRVPHQKKVALKLFHQLFHALKRQRAQNDQDLIKLLIFPINTSTLTIIRRYDNLKARMTIKLNPLRGGGQKAAGLLTGDG